MKRHWFPKAAVLLAAALAGCSAPSAPPAATPAAEPPAATARPDPTPTPGTPEAGAARIRVEGENGAVLYELNDSPAAASLLAQLPLEIEIEDYSTNEKIFYPPETLDTTDTPTASGGAGVLAYYEPWGDVVLFYDGFNENPGLFALGEAVEGAEAIAGLSGTVTISAEENSGPDAASDSEANGAPAVYMTTDLTAQGLVNVYNALEAAPQGRIAVKLSTGEPGSNYLRPELIGDLVASLREPTIVECNTAYGGQRANTAMHYQVAEDHGYTALAPVDIMDEEGSLALPVTGGSNLTENYVGSHFANYDYFVVLSHFKGHSMAGYGGAIKNISIGIASSQGKAHIHSGGTGGSMWGGDQDAFLESMAEAGKSVADALGGNILYINVMNRLSVDCDCDGDPAEPDMHDIGILASCDPVALDQACIDLVYAAEDGGSLVERIESRNGLHTLEHAEAIGLGSRRYTLVSIDG